MVSPVNEAGRNTDETPHEVTLTRGFWLMEHEVTQGEWEAVMGKNPSKFKACGADCPVERVSPKDVEEYAGRVSQRDGVEYRRPTEAEWEWAARGGEAHIYAGSDSLGEVAWTGENSGKTTHAVCGLGRNGFGLCDMTGNVAEWVQDSYSEYPTGSTTNPVGTGRFVVFFRGCSWYNRADQCRVAHRGTFNLTPMQYGSQGLRLARSAP